MKNNLLKWGALIAALVLLAAACTQPTEDASSGNANKDVVIRLLLDRPEHQTLDVGDTFQIRVGQSVLSPARLVLEEAQFTTTTPVYIDTSTAPLLTPVNAAGVGVIAYPAGTYTIKRYVWRPNTRADGTGETGTNNKASIPLNRPRGIAFVPAGAPAAPTVFEAWLDSQLRLKTKQTTVGTNRALYTVANNTNLTAATAFSLLPFAAGAVGPAPAYAPNAGAAPSIYFYDTATQRIYVGTDDLQAIAGLASPAAATAPANAYTTDSVKIMVYHNESNENTVTLTPQYNAFIGNNLITGEWWTRAAGNDIHTILEDRIPTAKYFETGVVRITNGVPNIAQTAAAQDPGGVPKVVTTNSQYYVDIVLINKTPAAKEYGATLKSSFSGYMELEILPSSDYWDPVAGNLKGGVPTAPATWGGMNGSNYYMYTKDRHGFNSWNTAEGKWNTGNDYVKKVSLKPGINEIRLSYFSQGEGDVEFK
jgi:hypothetical protein